MSAQILVNSHLLCLLVNKLLLILIGLVKDSIDHWHCKHPFSMTMICHFNVFAHFLIWTSRQQLMWPRTRTTRGSSSKILFEILFYVLPAWFCTMASGHFILIVCWSTSSTWAVKCRLPSSKEAKFIAYWHFSYIFNAFSYWLAQTLDLFRWSVFGWNN